MDKIVCRTCDKEFENWDGLATHINSAKDVLHKKDRSGKMWAKRYIHRNAINKLNKIGRVLPYRTPLTDEDRIAKEDTRRELSGQKKLVPTICPRCNTGQRQPLEVEHTDNPQAWKLKNCYAIMCEGCR